jgi:hypothetical protein
VHEDEEESNADTDAETEDELENNNDDDDDDEDDSSSCQGDLERSTSSDAVPESLLKTGGSEVGRQLEREREKQKEATDAKSEEVSRPEEKEATKVNNEEEEEKKEKRAAESENGVATEEVAITRPPEKVLKKKGSIRAIKKKLSKLKKASGDSSSGSSIRRRKKDKGVLSDDEQEGKDKKGAGKDKAEKTEKSADTNKRAAGEGGVSHLAATLGSSLSTELSASGGRNRRPVTVYAKARHSEDTTASKTVNIGLRDVATDALDTLRDTSSEDDIPNGHAKGETEAGADTPTSGKADIPKTKSAIKPSRSASARARMRSTSLKDVHLGGPNGPTAALLGSARAPLPDKPLPPTPAMAVMSAKGDDATSGDADTALKTDSSAQADGPAPGSPSSSPLSSPSFSPGARSAVWGSSGARRSAGASLSSHRCSVAHPGASRSVIPRDG